MKTAFFLFFFINTSLFAQEILFSPIFLNPCTGEVVTSQSYFLTDNSTYKSKITDEHLVLPKSGTYWLHINTLDFEKTPIKLYLGNKINIDSFYSKTRIKLNHSCQRMCKDLYDNEPENFIGKYNAHYKSCDRPIKNALMSDFYFNGQLRIIGSLNENGQPIDTLKKYYNTGKLAELSVYNSKGQPQLLFSYYENGDLKTKIDFVEGKRLNNDSLGKEMLLYKFKIPTYRAFGKRIDTIKRYYDNDSLRELIAFDHQNKPQLILSYHKNGNLKTKLDLKKRNGLSFYSSGKERITSEFKLIPSYNNNTFYINIKEYYENGQLKSYGGYKQKKLKDFYNKEEHKTFGIDKAIYFQSYYENGQLKFSLEKDKLRKTYSQSYYKNGQLKFLLTEDQYGKIKSKSYYEGGQLKSLLVKSNVLKKSKEFHKNGRLKTKEFIKFKLNRTYTEESEDTEDIEDTEESGKCGEAIGTLIGELIDELIKELSNN